MDLRPPSDWQAFERLCCDLWKEVWKTDEVHLHGRRGQSQFGVDIFGIPINKDDYFGIQCKGKADFTNKSITKTELEEEIKKAEDFDPPIKHLIFATTSQTDANIQKEARKISKERKNEGAFTISIQFWQDIKQKLNLHINVAKAHFPQLFDNTKEIEEIQRLKLVVEKKDIQNVQIKQKQLKILNKYISFELPGLETGFPSIPIDTISIEILNDIKDSLPSIDDIVNKNYINIDNDWNSQRICFLTGNFWYFLRNYEKALKIYTLLENTNILSLSNKPSFYKNKLFFNKGTSFRHMGNYRESISELQKSLLIENDTFSKLSMYNNIGIAHELLKEFKTAIEYYDKIIDLNIDHFIIWYNRSVSLTLLEEYNESIDNLNKSIDLNPNFALSHLNKGANLANLGMFDEAHDFLITALDIDPNNSLIKSSIGRVLSKMGVDKMHESLRYHNEAINSDSGNAMFWYNKGYSLFDFSEFENSIECLDKTIELFAENKVYGFNLADIWNNKGLCYLNLRNFEQAEIHFNKALDLGLDSNIYQLNTSLMDSLKRQ